MDSKKRGRGVGPRLNDLQRLEIIQRYKTAQPPVSLRQLARDFGVDEKSIRRVIKAAPDIESRATSSAVLHLRGNVHRRPAPRFPELEKALAGWIDAQERAKADISPSVVIDKAKLIARSMGISPEEFKASWGWYDKFSRRYGVRTAFLGSKEREEGTRDCKSLQELHQLMTHYDPEWVFTVEETSVFYDALPFNTDVGSRNRVTVVLSCNSSGRIALPVAVIGKEKLQNTSPVPYFMQERAWLDRPTFGRWYSSVFLPFVRERTSKPVLLVVDGEQPGHQGDFEEGGARLVFLPPSLSRAKNSSGTGEITNPKAWWSRPMDMGVIAALKAKYKLLLVQNVLSYHTAPDEVKAALEAAEGKIRNGGLHFGHPPTVLDAARLLEQAWSQVPDDLLTNCFARANLIPPSKLLAPTALPTGMNALEEQSQASMRYNDDVAVKIEEMLRSRTLPVHFWGVSKLRPADLRDRIRAFMYLDDENSFELQRRLQDEIKEALSDQNLLPAMDPLVLASTVSHQDEPEPEHDLESQVRGILLGITDIASRLRLLPAGADAATLAPLQVEGCIAAADQIRHCIQAFDNKLHDKRKTVEQVWKPSDQVQDDHTTSV
ncbi:Jerky -like [Phytophthora citrophthora]|uniref:Jerky -like n=1 Tax=Phytophthora citrophthora TaxID=4793 RepID=A0AAD9GQ10_9STRA|nr:Jerky -like [Phytophthora citrophthora]